MAEIRTGQYNFNTLQTAKMPNVSQIYAQVGQQLNQMYYQNRQAYIQGIANPLSQMKANKDDESLLNEERARLTAGAEEFKEQDNWHRAQNYIFNTVEDIVSNEALQAITSKYQQRQQYLTELKDSGWDSQMQNYFINASDYFSQAVEYDRENNKVIKGGFAAIQHGNPIDLTKDYFMPIAELMSKVPASGRSGEGISAQGALEQGLASIVGMDSEAFVTAYLKSGFSQEGVSFESIRDFSYSILMNDPKVTNYLRTVEEASIFNMRFQPDANNPRGGELRDITPEMMYDIFPQSRVINSLSGAGISLSDIGSLNDNGTFTINHKMSKDTKDKLEVISLATGYDIVKFLENGHANIEDGSDTVTLDNFLNSSLNNLIDGEFENYLRRNNISQDDPNIESYKEDYYIRMRVNNRIQGTILNQANSIAGVMSWQKTKTWSDITFNPLAKEALRERYRRKAKLEEEQEEFGMTTASNLPDIEVDEITTASQQAEQIRLGEVISSAKNESNNVAIKSNLYDKLKPVYDIEKGDINSLLELDFNELQSNSKLKLSEDDLAALWTLGRNKNLIYQAQGAQESFQLTVKEGYDVLREKGTFGGIDSQDNFIIKNNIITYNDYLDHVENSKQVGNNRFQPVIGRSKALGFLNTGDQSSDRDAITGNYKILTAEEFSKRQSIILDKANQKSVKDTGNSLKYTTKATIVYNPSSFTRQYVNNGIANLATNANDWILDEVQGTKNFKKDMGLSVANNENLIKLLSTYSPRSSSGTISNIDKVGLSAKETGLSADTHSIDYFPVYDPSGIASNGQRKFTIKAIFKDVNGATIGSANVSRNISEGAYNKMLQSDWNNIRTYQSHNPEMIGNSIFDESAGNIASQTAQTIFKFNPISNIKETVEANNTLDLEMKARNLPIGNRADGTGDKLYVNSPMILPYSGDVIYNPYFEIERVSMGNGQFGYKVAMVQPDQNGNLDYNNVIDLKMGDNNPVARSMTRNTIHPDITSAFKDLSRLSLDIGFQMQYGYTE